MAYSESEESSALSSHVTHPNPLRVIKLYKKTFSASLRFAPGHHVPVALRLCLLDDLSDGLAEDEDLVVDVQLVVLQEAVLLRVRPLDLKTRLGKPLST